MTTVLSRTPPAALESSVNRSFIRPLAVSVLAHHDFGLLFALGVGFAAEQRPGTAPLDRDYLAVAFRGRRVLVVRAGQRSALVNGELQGITLGQQGGVLAGVLTHQDAVDRVIGETQTTGAVIQHDLVRRKASQGLAL